MNKFVKLLEDERAKLRMSYRKFAVHLGMSHTQVTNVLKGSSVITFDFCAEIAPKIGISPIDAFKLAGLLAGEGSGENGKCQG